MSKQSYFLFQTPWRSCRHCDGLYHDYTWALDYRFSRDTNTYDCDCFLCVSACEASFQCWINRRKSRSPQTQLTRRRILSFRRSVDDLGEYYTDPSKRNCFAEIRVDSTLNLKIIHWDLCHNACQHPCDSLVRPFEWQPKQQRKMQHWENCIQITWTFHNFCSKESRICRQHIFSTISFIFLTQWTHGNKFSEISIEMRTFWLKKVHLKMSSAKWRPFRRGQISVIRLYFVFPVKAG